MTETTYYTLTSGSGSWKVSLHSPDDRPTGEFGGAEAIIMIDDVTTVLVREDSGRLNTPGAHPHDGETIEDAMHRAVREKACAEVVSSALIAYTRTERLDGPNAGKIMIGSMSVARATMLPWEASAGVIKRVEVPLDDLVTIMSADWAGLDDFSVELVARAKRSLSVLGS
ncbi:MAG: hypothetical protein M9953_08040 [Thermomicrobiales bacterium]|nr:hypothetical protein [Thermomicrobiales bacterium]MCO5225271.1 hypothetical protein [Thermomicrobiales bacterium]